MSNSKRLVEALGGGPPVMRSKEEKAAIVARYESLWDEVEKLVADHGTFERSGTQVVLRAGKKSWAAAEVNTSTFKVTVRDRMGTNRKTIAANAKKVADLLIGMLNPTYSNEE